MRNKTAKKLFFICLIFIIGIFSYKPINYVYYKFIQDSAPVYDLLEKSMNEFVKDKNAKITKNDIDVTNEYKHIFIKLYNEKNFKELAKIIEKNNLSFGYKGE